MIYHSAQSDDFVVTSFASKKNYKRISCTSIGIPSLWVGGPDGRYILKIRYIFSN